MPYFTLILPCYKVAAYVERCVRSILAQDFTDYEIILVDDGSPDETPAVCDHLAAEQACIRVIHKPNGGLSSARNAGVEAARGHYIWFVDSDDWIEPGALTLLHRACEAGTPEIIKFSHFRVTDKSVPVQHSVSPGLYEGRVRCDLLRCQAMREASRYCLSAWSHVYRRDFLEDHSLTFVSERVVGSEDYLFNLQALLCASDVYVLPDALYSYELRSGSLTQTYKPDLPERYCVLYRLLTEYACERGEREYLPMINRFFVTHLIKGTCFHYEYKTITPMHTIKHARQNVRKMLLMRDVQSALKQIDRTALDWKKQLQLIAMRLRCEVLFYYLYT